MLPTAKKVTCLLTVALYCFLKLSKYRNYVNQQSNSQKKAHSGGLWTEEKGLFRYVIVVLIKPLILLIVIVFFNLFIA